MVAVNFKNISFPVFKLFFPYNSFQPPSLKMMGQYYCQSWGQNSKFSIIGCSTQKEYVAVLKIRLFKCLYVCSHVCISNTQYISTVKISKIRGLTHFLICSYFIYKVINKSVVSFMWKNREQKLFRKNEISQTEYANCNVENGVICGNAL